MDRPAKVPCARKSSRHFPCGRITASHGRRAHHRPIRQRAEPDRLRQRSDFWTATLITVCWNGFGTRAISTAGGRRLLRQVRPGTSVSAHGPQYRIDRFHVVRLTLTRGYPHRPWRRRSRYLACLTDDPLSRVLRGAGADRLIFPRHGRPGRHAVGVTFLPILPCPARPGAGGMSSSSAFPYRPAPSGPGDRNRAGHVLYRHPP